MTSKFPRSKQMSEEKLLKLAKEFDSPFWAYDAEIIKTRVEQLRSFDVIRYAQKANSNVNILRLMKSLGTKIDAVSPGEIERALRAGFEAGTAENEIVFTADVIDDKASDRVMELKIPINCGSIDMLRVVGRRENSENYPVFIRINPGFGHGHSQKTNTGGENSKHGIWHEDLPEALAVIKECKLKLIGFHMHIGSGLFSKNFDRVCDAMAELVCRCDVDIEAISAGGGIPIAYREEETAVDTENYFRLWNEAKNKIENRLGHAITMEIEPGRFLVAESGILVTKVLAVKRMGSKKYALVNSGFHDLMRPAMYGSFHHITVLGDTSTREKEEIVIAGHLCESGDMFTQGDGGIVQTRLLPKLAVGDYLVFHDVGAYGASMSSNYNSWPLIPEVLFINNEAQVIRKSQTVDELMQLEEVQ